MGNVISAWNAILGEMRAGCDLTWWTNPYKSVLPALLRSNPSQSAPSEAIQRLAFFVLLCKQPRFQLVFVPLLLLALCSVPSPRSCALSSCNVHTHTHCGSCLLAGPGLETSISATCCFAWRAPSDLGATAATPRRPTHCFSLVKVAAFACSRSFLDVRGWVGQR